MTKVGDLYDLKSNIFMKYLDFDRVKKSKHPNQLAGKEMKHKFTSRFDRHCDIRERPFSRYLFAWDGLGQ